MMSRLLRQRWPWLCLLGLATLAVGWVYLQARHARDLADPEQSRRRGRPIPVRTALVEETQVEQMVGATGLTVASDMATIQIGPSREFNSINAIGEVVLKTVRVHEGDAVSQGQVLFEIDVTSFHLLVKQREATLTAARVELDRTKKSVQLNEAIRKLGVASGRANLAYRTEDLATRQKELVALEKLTRVKAASEFDYFEARSRLTSAEFQLKDAHLTLQRAENTQALGDLEDQSRLARALSAVESAQVDLEVSRRNLERCRITSPLAGFADRVDLVPGQVVGVGVPFTRILKLDPIHVRLDLPQERIDDVRIGQKAEVVVDSFPKETFAGTVIRIAPLVQHQLRTLPVVVEIPNPQQRIKAGTSCFARLPVRKKAITVPSVAVIEQGSQATVFRVENGRARLRAVRTGWPVANGAVEVCDGLAAGDEVVIFHNFYRDVGTLARKQGYLEDNDPVDVDWRRWARRE